MEWSKIDLHIHAEHGLTYNGKTEGDEDNYYSLLNMIKRNKAYDLKLVSLTEHNKINIINNIKLRYSLENYGNSTSLPAVEIDIVINEKRYHVIIVFSNKVNLIEVDRRIVSLLNNKGKKVYLSIDEFMEVIQDTECIVIPHGCKKQGFKQEEKDEVDNEVAITLVDILRSGNFVNFLFEHTRPHFKGSFAKNIIKNASVNWLTVEEMNDITSRFGAGVTGSDFRFKEKEFTSTEQDFTAIWATPTFRGLELACLFPENRIAMFSQVIEKSHYISKIVIEDNEHFENSSISLSSGLNSVIGSSATGKTTLLHIIASKLNDKKINNKQYTFTDQLDVKFFDKDNNPINKSDIEIEISDNLYEKIETIHNSDISGILKLFDYKVNKKSPVIEEYEKKINEYSKINKEFLEKNTLSRSNFVSFSENIKNYMNNFKSASKQLIDYTIPKGSYGKLSNDFDELNELSKNFTIFKNQINNLNNSFEEIKFVLSKFSIKNEFSNIIKLLTDELLKVRKQLNIKILEMKYSLLIHKKIAPMIDTVNKKIGQKSEYMQRLINNAINNKDNLIYNLKRKLILDKKSKVYNLTFPIDELKKELSEANKNDYIDLEIIDSNSLYEVNADSGIIDYNRNSAVLKKYKDKSIKEDEDLKDMIKEINTIGNIPRFRKTEILETLIEKSILKLGYPNQDKTYIDDVSPGDASKIYIDYKFKNDFKSGKFNVVLFDQPENDLDKEFIFNDLLTQINKLKNEAQVILTSHDPLIVVNGDSNVVIKASKNKKKIKYESSNLEDYIDDIPITSIISKFVDGHEEAVKKRFEIYTGGNKKWK